MDAKKLREIANANNPALIQDKRSEEHAFKAVLKVMEQAEKFARNGQTQMLYSPPLGLEGSARYKCNEMLIKKGFQFVVQSENNFSYTMICW